MVEERLQKIADMLDKQSKEEKLNTIKLAIERIKEREESVDSKATGVAAVASGRQIEFSKRVFDLMQQERRQNIFSPATVSAVGSVYSSFEGPLSTLSSLIAALPLSSGLEDDLEASGTDVSVEAYLIISTVASVFMSLMIMFFAMTLGVLLNDSAIVLIGFTSGPVIFVAALAFLLKYPGMIAGERAAKVERELPFALRHLSTQLKAGVSFNRAMASIAQADYGLLSEEFKRMLAELDSGMSNSQALNRLIKRIRSRGLKKAVMQIQRALRTGGNLSEIISSIAEDVSYELRMQIRDFTEKLNIISVAYIFVGVVSPVVATVLSAVAQLPLLGGNVPFGLILGSFMGFLVGMLAILLIIKRIDPGTVI
jgi:flagellar protein FlaJ